MVKQFLIKGAFFVISIFIFFYFLALFIDSGLRKTKSGNFAEWNDIYNSNINADLIVLGSSRAWVHISPKILDSILLINSYNLGIDGYNFEMQYNRFKIYLQHNKKPKYTINSLDISSFDRRKDLYMHTQFLPYLNDSLIRSAVKGYEGELNALHYYIPMFKYIGQYNSISKGLLEELNIKQFNDYKYKGYLGMERTWNNEFDQFKKENKNGLQQAIRKDNIALFKEYLAYCQNNDIKVFLVYSPEYFEAQSLFLNRDSIINIYSDCAKQYNAAFINFSNDSICMNKNLFYNSQHLTKIGAETFSVKLANKLKNIMQNN